VELWVTDEFLEMIEDLQSILGKSKMTPTLEWAVTDVLKRKDPVKHAERAKKKPSPSKVETPKTFKDAKKPDQSLSKTQAGPSRPKTPAAEKHKVDLRDERRCTYIDPKTGERCNCKFGLEYHHSIPLASGGPDTADNIFTICRDHHRQEHRYF
jgi:5-methylcytosine-specific restriction endonuclease McrA